MTSTHTTATYGKRNVTQIVPQSRNHCGGDTHEGYIGFQDHGDDVWYRNIRIKIME